MYGIHIILQHLFYFLFRFLNQKFFFFLLWHYFVFHVFALNMAEYLVFYFVQKMLRYLFSKYYHANLD